MRTAANPFLSGLLSPFETEALSLADARPHPAEDALSHTGMAIINELLDVIADTALEDHQATLIEGVIGGLHSALQRVEREADKARDQAQILMRDFDGSEIADTELQEAVQTAKAADVAAQAIIIIRDAAAASYTTATGEVWIPWRGNVRASKVTAALIEAKAALRFQKARRQGEADPGAVIVAFRGSPAADTQEDASRIFDALNWALATHPDMALATSGARGAEKIAIRWAQQKAVKLILSRPDFERTGKSAPFKVNDELLALEPVLCLTLSDSLNPQRAALGRPSGVALNLGQKAREAGVRHLEVTRR